MKRWNKNSIYSNKKEIYLTNRTDIAIYIFRRKTNFVVMEEME